MALNDQPGSIFKQGITVIDVETLIFKFFLIYIFRQHKGFCISLLIANKISYLIYFRGIYKSTLQSRKISIIANEHVSFSDQLFGAANIQNCAAINFATYFKRNARGKVCLNGAGNYIYRRPLCGNDQMNANSSRKLRQSCNWHLYFLSSSHNKIGKFINDQNNERKELVAFLRV